MVDVQRQDEHNVAILHPQSSKQGPNRQTKFSRALTFQRSLVSLVSSLSILRSVNLEVRSDLDGATGKLPMVRSKPNYS